MMKSDQKIKIIVAKISEFSLIPHESTLKIAYVNVLVKNQNNIDQSYSIISKKVY